MPTLVEINEQGVVSFVHSDALEPLRRALSGRPLSDDTKRASHVEPHSDGWNVDLSPVGGPGSLCTCDTRQEALDREVEWLNQNRDQVVASRVK